MNLSELVTRCKARYQDPSNRVWTDGDWEDYINDAYDTILVASEFWPFLEHRVDQPVITAGSNSTTLPTDVFRVTSVYNKTSGLPLNQMDGRSTYRYAYPDPSQRGTPLVYQAFDNTIEIFPIPDVNTTLTVDYFVHPSAMNSGTDTPVIPRAYHRVIVSGALALAYQDDDHIQQHSLHTAAFAAGIERMKQELLGPRTGLYPTITDTF